MSQKHKVPQKRIRRNFQHAQDSFWFEENIERTEIWSDKKKKKTSRFVSCWPTEYVSGQQPLWGIKLTPHTSVPLPLYYKSWFKCSQDSCQTKIGKTGLHCNEFSCVYSLYDITKSCSNGTDFSTSLDTPSCPKLGSTKLTCSYLGCKISAWKSLN